MRPGRATPLLFIPNMGVMFGDDDEGKNRGDLVRFGKKAFIAVIFIVGAPTIIAPLMGVDINSFCSVESDERCSENALFSDEVTGLIGIVLNAIRIGGAVIVILAFGIKGIQYRFVRGAE